VAPQSAYHRLIVVCKRYKRPSKPTFFGSKQTSSARVTKALRLDGTMQSGGRLCRSGKRRRLKEIGSRSRASLSHCRRSFHRPFCFGHSAAHSYRRRRGLRSMGIGAHIRYAQIGWHGRLLPSAERPAAGLGGSAITAKAGCQRHSGRRRRHIANAHTRIRDSVACAGNRFIASGGMWICGTLAPTRMRTGTVPVWSHGNSGMRRAARRGSCAACRSGAAAKVADGCGRTPRWTPHPAVSGVERTP
jgi:hypothetical protein